MRDCPPATDRQRRWADQDTRVLLAVLQGHRTYSELMAATRLHRMAVRGALLRLLADGLVTWQPGLQATLRPLVRQVR